MSRRRRPPARVLEFQWASPADRTFVALLGRRMRPHLAERLQEISLAAAGLPKSVSTPAQPLAIHTLFDLALAWPWQIERLTASGYSRARLAAVLIAALDGTLDVPVDVPRTDAHG